MSSFLNNETPPSNIVFLYKLNLKTPFLVHITCKNIIPCVILAYQKKTSRPLSREIRNIICSLHVNLYPKIYRERDYLILHSLGQKMESIYRLYFIGLRNIVKRSKNFTPVEYSSRERKNAT
jgi:ArsR family metal-binding transcriptional regulator